MRGGRLKPKITHVPYILVLWVGIITLCLYCFHYLPTKAKKYDETARRDLRQLAACLESLCQELRACARNGSAPNGGKTRWIYRHSILGKELPPVVGECKGNIHAGDECFFESILNPEDGSFRLPKSVQRCDCFHRTEKK